MICVETVDPESERGDGGEYEDSERIRKCRFTGESVDPRRIMVIRSLNEEMEVNILIRSASVGNGLYGKFLSGVRTTVLTQAEVDILIPEC
jgi:hypothetical protein